MFEVSKLSNLHPEEVQSTWMGLHLHPLGKNLRKGRTERVSGGRRMAIRCLSSGAAMGHLHSHKQGGNGMAIYMPEDGKGGKNLR